jgi:hypothetical protein
MLLYYIDTTPYINAGLLYLCRSIISMLLRYIDTYYTTENRGKSSSNTVGESPQDI